MSGITPETSGKALAAIAQHYPDSWVEIARHRNAYPALLHWLDEYGDEEVREAISQRISPPPPEAHPQTQPPVALREVAESGSQISEVIESEVGDDTPIEESPPPTPVKPQPFTDVPPLNPPPYDGPPPYLRQPVVEHHIVREQPLISEDVTSPVPPISQPLGPFMGDSSTPVVPPKAGGTPPRPFSDHYLNPLEQTPTVPPVPAPAPYLQDPRVVTRNPPESNEICLIPEVDLVPAELGGQQLYMGLSRTPVEPQTQTKQASLSIAFVILGLFIPLAGLFIFLLWKDRFPQKAKSAGWGALIGAIVLLIGVVVYFIRYGPLLLTFFT